MGCNRFLWVHLWIVSHPMTLDYHKNEMDWQAVMKEALSLGYCSHDTITCGLHVHVNRNAFGENQSEQEEVISRILFFVEKHWAELFQFSRRSIYNMNRYSSALRAGTSANYILINDERRPTEREMLRIQGFPDTYKIVVPYSKIKKQTGNSVAVPVIMAVANEMLSALKNMS